MCIRDRSMNIPTFSLFLKVGFEKLDTQWRRMGFTFPLDNTPSVSYTHLRAQETPEHRRQRQMCIRDRSMNIPTFSLFLKVGFEKLDTQWRRMGFTFPLDNTPSVSYTHLRAHETPEH